MLNFLIRVARFLIIVAVLVFTGIGAILGGNAVGGEGREGGYILGAFGGFLISAVVFGVAAAILDMQRSLRELADAARKASRRETSPPSG